MRAGSLCHVGSGRQLAAASAPDTWNTTIAGAIIVQANREAIEKCRKAASKVNETVR